MHALRSDKERRVFNTSLMYIIAVYVDIKKTKQKKTPSDRYEMCEQELSNGRQSQQHFKKPYGLFFGTK